ncbi:carboxypeptidase regulatory-like domain-containing protein [Candidatus Sumerlaeota bacterium]|nr:carboxypeptidase regulatory-like domain-containing protein [Candidatus Sumerlaeota bacterium]
MNKKFWIFPALAILIVVLIFVVSNQEREASLESGSPGKKETPQPLSSSPIAPAVSEEDSQKVSDVIAKSVLDLQDVSTTSREAGEITSDETTSGTAGALRIFGVVKKDNGVPLAGAELRAVVIENLEDRILGEEKGIAGSDDNGDYQIMIPGGMDYMVYAGAKGYAMKQSPAFWKKAGTKREIRIDFVLSPGMSIEGVVKDTEGNPIKDAKVSPFYQQAGGEERIGVMEKQIAPSALSVLTDESGEFLLVGLYPGLYTLAAFKEGYSPALKRDAPSPSENVEIIMEKGEGCVISGNVFYFSSGEAAGEANVKVRSAPFTPGGIVLKTGNLGDFRFTGLIPGIYEIDAEKDGMQSLPYDPIDLMKQKEKSDVILKLFSGYTISGHVYEEKGMKVVPGVEVSVRANLEEEGIYEISDQDGFYQISGIFSRNVFIFGELDGFFHVGDSGANSPKSLELPEDQAELKNVDLTMSRGVRVSGKVVAESDQSPISRATVRFVTEARILGRRAKPMTTDSSGVFSGYVQNHTRLTIRASHPEYAEESTNPIAVSDRPVENIVIELGKGGAVRGVVVDPDREPVSGARVRGSAPAASAGTRRRSFGPREAFTDAEGRFVMEQAPAGEFNLTATADGYSPSKTHIVRVPEGGESEEVTIILAASNFIRGFVRDESGDPVVGAKITARHVTNVNRVYKGASEPDGVFRIEGIVKGKYRVRAEKGDLASKAVQVEQNSENVVLILVEKDYTTLYGRVVDSETGEPVTSYRLRAESGGKIYGTFTNPEGEFFIEELIRGRQYRFYIEAAGYVTTMSPPVTIPKEGEPPHAEFLIGKGGAIFGMVLYNINKAPVNGAKITCILTSLLPKNPGSGKGEVSYTGKDGVFLYEGLAPGKYAIKVEKTGYPELLSECEVKDGEVTDAGELLLKASGRIRGKVLDKQDPPQGVPDKIVNLSSIGMSVPIQMSYNTGSDGVFIFKDLPEGKYTVRPVGSEYKPATVELKPGEIKWIQFKPK